MDGGRRGHPPAVDDSHGLQRFVDAQGGGTYERAVAELRAGRKQSHWMWFVLPQVAGLGRSSTAQHYALAGLGHARAYLAHPLLGARLRECAQVLTDLPTTDPVAVMGAVDAVKLRSAMTLFSRAAPDEPLFGRVLDRYYLGEEDPETLSRL